MYFLHIKQTPSNYYYEIAFGISSLLGGTIGIIKSRKWGMLKSDVGRALFFISTGTIAWGVGQMFWSILYNILYKVEVPYPSLADVGYIAAIPLWAIGIFYLSYATGLKFSLRNILAKVYLIIVPLILVAFSYYLLILVAREGQVTDFNGGFGKVFFDLAYPTGDLVILTLSVLIYSLSIKILGGRFKYPIIIIIIGFIFEYLADFSFSYTTTYNTYYDGHWVDILFPTAMALISFGVSCFDTKES
jgi:hypothetical protein